MKGSLSGVQKYCVDDCVVKKCCFQLYCKIGSKNINVLQLIMGKELEFTI